MTAKTAPADGDCSLAARIRSGDAAAEEEFVLRFRGRVLALTRARGCDADTADDIVQETLLGVLCALRVGGLRDEQRLPQFVAGTARNLVHNYYRVKSRPLEGDVDRSQIRWDTAQELGRAPHHCSSGDSRRFATWRPGGRGRVASLWM